MLGQQNVHKMVHKLPTTIAEVANLTIGRLTQLHTEIVIQQKFVDGKFFEFHHFGQVNVRLPVTEFWKA